MAKKTLDVRKDLGRTNLAEFISYTWQSYHTQRIGIINQWKELRDYVFATDTSTTTNGKLPWKNSTTTPKLCQIRDNLHSNYISALFPNDEWLQWEAYSRQGAAKDKAEAIRAYMSNKTRISGFRDEIDKLVYDYIDYGNAFATTDYVTAYMTNTANEKVIDYQGPVAKRISPYDIVFNPLANSFAESWKIVRAIKTLGELKADSLEQPDNVKLHEALLKRAKLKSVLQTHSIEDQDKAQGFSIDGFGNYSEYINSGYVELLNFYGDYYDEETDTLYKGHHIVVMDRMHVVYNEPIPDWLGSAPIYHVGWRKRPDNLWAMGPLDNLVGMQYRIDHLENAKADAMDLAIMPPIKVKGDVEAFAWGPNARIDMDENADIEELARNVQWVLQADSAIDRLEMKMEQYAGAPREAMGIRTPGEKTAFEVQRLDNAAGRIFQEKVSNFEIQLLEKVLNSMLEQAKRHLDSSDTVAVVDDDISATVFMSITKNDITASGVIRPIGARHFAAQAQLVQNLTQLSNTQVWTQITPHTSSIALSKLVEDVLGLRRYQLFKPNISVTEQQQTARLMNQASESLMVEQTVPPPA